MRNFQKIIMEINSTLTTPKFPEAKNLIPKMNKPSQKRNENDQSKVAGKYFKSQDNVSKSMVSNQDREKATEKGQLKSSLDTSVDGTTRVMSKDRFDKVMNDSGGRTLNLSDGKEKTMNSKTTQYKVKMLKDGRVQIRKSTLGGKVS